MKLAVSLALTLGLIGPIVWVGSAKTAPNSSRQIPIAQSKEYAAAIEMLERFGTHEMADKELPAISIALVDDQQIVWAKGFGFADPQAKVPATAETIYRVGSVSKLFTDIAVMQLVEQGKLDLDAPVTRYLPDFRPRNPFGKKITLRQLMSHRSGLVREPPVGNYFETTEPSLARTIASLNRTALVYAPEARTKYSNAAIAPVGYVLERTQREAFAKYLKRVVLDPLGLERSSFEPTPEITKDLAKAYMWTIDGRVFEAPTFELGMSPAGSMYTTVTDMGRFISALFAGGRGVKGQVLKPSTIEQMWTPQFGPPGQKTGYGIGFGVREFEGRRTVGHGGAIYGFATTLKAMPDDKLGVVVVTTKDAANAVTNRIADFALKTMLAAYQAKVFKFPDRGLYDGERLIFTRDKNGRATQVEAASVVFKRRNVGPEEGAGQLRIEPLRPVSSLLKEAVATQPPKETGEFRQQELVELSRLDPTIKLDVRYATTNNFLGVSYSEPRAFLQRPAAEVLVRAHQKLKEKGYGLLIHDAYRPWYVRKVFWDATPSDKKLFVADPAKGSRHNRGAAVDLTLYDLGTGKAVEMVGTYDETTDRSYPDYPGGTSLQRWHRDLLRDAMESEGFAVFEAEWWHSITRIGRSTRLVT